MTASLALALLLALPPASPAGNATRADGGDRPFVLVVVGTPGEPEYAAEFRRWAVLWKDAASKASAEVLVVGLDETGSDPADLDRLRTELTRHAEEGREPLWLVLIGHGTYDGREAKFNLRGPDLTDAELAKRLAAVRRPVAVIDCTAASGAFLTRVSGENRVVVTATRSGSEQNYARFGGYLAAAVSDPSADLDKDGQVSLLEAFLTASGKTAEFYKARSRLATEHPLLDDNGDRLGTPADWFRGVRATRRAKEGAAADGTRAHQLHLVPSDGERALPAATRARRDELELELNALREKKASLPADAYESRLQEILVGLARLYAAAAPDPKAR